MILKDKPQYSSFLQLGNNFSQIASGPNSITTTNDSGNYINGPLSISSSIENIKVAGIFRFNPMLSTCIPSTMITPMPTLKLDMPVSNIGTMAKIAALASSLVI